MTDVSDETQARQNAHSVLATSMRSVVSEFENWASDASSDSEVRKVRAAIAGHVKAYLGHFLEFTVANSHLVPVGTWIRAGENLESEVRRLGLHEQLGFDGCDRVIDWLSQDFLMLIDDTSLGGNTASSPEYRQKLYKLNLATTELRNMNIHVREMVNWEELRKEVQNATHGLQSSMAQLDEFRSLETRLSKLEVKTRDAVESKLEEFQELGPQFSLLEKSTRESIAEMQLRAEEQTLEHTQKVDSLKALISDAEAALQKVQTSNEAAATNELSASFKDLNDRSSKQYRLYLAVSTLTFGIAISLAMILRPVDLLSIDNQGDADWPTAIWRLAILGSTVGLAAFLARQAHHFRTLSTWADSTQVQLQTFRAYTDLLADSPIRDELRTEFAKRVFGPDPTLVQAATERTETKASSSEKAPTKIPEKLQGLKINQAP